MHKLENIISTHKNHDISLENENKKIINEMDQLKRNNENIVT